MFQIENGQIVVAIFWGVGFMAGDFDNVHVDNVWRWRTNVVLTKANGCAGLGYRYIFHIKMNVFFLEVTYSELFRQ